MLRVAFLTASSSCLSTISRFTPAERPLVRHGLRKCFTSHFCVREIPACPRLPRLSTTSVCVRFPPVHDFRVREIPACPRLRLRESSRLSTISRFTPAERQLVRPGHGNVSHRISVCVRFPPVHDFSFATFRSRARLLLDAAVGDANSSLGSGRDRFVVRHHHQRHALGVRGSE